MDVRHHTLPPSLPLRQSELHCAEILDDLVARAFGVHFLEVFNKQISSRRAVVIGHEHIGHPTPSQPSPEEPPAPPPSAPKQSRARAPAAASRREVSPPSAKSRSKSAARERSRSSGRRAEIEARAKSAMPAIVREDGTLVNRAMMDKERKAEEDRAAAAEADKRRRERAAFIQKRLIRMQEERAAREKEKEQKAEADRQQQEKHAAVEAARRRAQLEPKRRKLAEFERDREVRRRGRDKEAKSPESRRRQRRTQSDEAARTNPPVAREPSRVLLKMRGHRETERKLKERINSAFKSDQITAILKKHDKGLRKVYDVLGIRKSPIDVSDFAKIVQCFGLQPLSEMKVVYRHVAGQSMSFDKFTEALFHIAILKAGLNSEASSDAVLAAALQLLFDHMNLPTPQFPTLRRRLADYQRYGEVVAVFEPSGKPLADRVRALARVMDTVSPQAAMKEVAEGLGALEEIAAKTNQQRLSKSLSQLRVDIAGGAGKSEALPRLHALAEEVETSFEHTARPHEAPPPPIMIHSPKKTEKKRPDETKKPKPPKPQPAQPEAGDKPADDAPHDLERPEGKERQQVEPPQAAEQAKQQEEQEDAQPSRDTDAEPESGGKQGAAAEEEAGGQGGEGARQGTDEEAADQGNTEGEASDEKAEPPADDGQE
ncbi:unnamed protein product [Vitrella brassicaformis CCMP3155]|uniref:Uncharacterized protein n=1 Tax=Vitrella brassicaformis (strain CCMP3155) TaxID=1169540 RepID=A0A0G4EZA2_VITBC|nr:unnamed protein product [Vitrella brassicaformis CCMP3155]|eukprot:CEM04107.1 unnamed protein product [Vitrella brassicaformis CCMP3155]